MTCHICLHEEIDNSEIDNIIRIKDQHWKHGVASQREWFETNYTEGDVHVTLYLKHRCIAYLSMTRTWVLIDNTEKKYVYGIGCVCVDMEYEHTGVGRELMGRVNSYLSIENKVGILLCRKAVLGFYKKCLWNELQIEDTYVNGVSFDGIVMAYNLDVARCESLHIEKSF